MNTIDSENPRCELLNAATEYHCRECSQMNIKKLSPCAVGRGCVDLGITRMGVVVVLK